MKKIIFKGIFMLICSLKVYSQDALSFVGIPDNQFKYSAAQQEESNWCWAASISMLLSYESIHVSQAEIVSRSFGIKPNGQLPNWGGSIEVMTANLNNWGVDFRGKIYYVKSKFNNYRPSDTEIINLLSKKKPILISYRSGPTTNHAVLVTSCTYSNSLNGPIIQKLTVRDPWPSDENVQNLGVAIYNYDIFFPLINYFWDVSVELGGEYYTLNDYSAINTPFFVNLRKIIDGFDNDFINVKGERIGNTDHMFYSKVSLTNELRPGYIYQGELPFYHVQFYRGANADSATVYFNYLKSNFSLPGKTLVEEIAIPLDGNKLQRKSQEIKIHLNSGLIMCIYLGYSPKDTFKPYTVSFKVGTKGMP